MEIKTITLPTRKIEVEVYAPAQTWEQVPGVLLLHELFGILDVYREDAKDLANRGYLVYVPNLFSGGAVKYCIRAMVSKAGRINAADSEVNQEIHVLLDALKADPRSNGRLGMFIIILWEFKGQAYRKKNLWMTFAFCRGIGQTLIHSVQQPSATNWFRNWVIGLKPIPITCRMVSAVSVVVYLKQRWFGNAQLNFLIVN